MINEKNPEKTKLLIKKSISPILVKAHDHEYNRKLCEYGRFQALVFPSAEKNKRRSLRFIDSGLDSVSAKAAAKNNIEIAIDILEIFSLNKEQKALALESLIQIIKLCRKAKTKLKLINYKNEKSAFAFLISLGSSSQQAKSALEN